VKTSYGGAILIRNDAESRKLALYQQQEAAMQQALPVPDEDKPSKSGQATPMEVVDSPLRAGDLHYGYQAVADNLPNDPRIHAEKGSKKMFFKNFLDARVNYVILPLAQRLLVLAQTKDVSGEGYTTAVILHEISHGLGPAFAHVDGKQVDINEAIGPSTAGWRRPRPTYGDLSGEMAGGPEAAAGERTEQRLRVVRRGMFRSLRFGTAEAHGRAQMMEFNYLLEHKALTQGADGRYTIDYAAMSGAIAGLDEKLLLLEANGDRAGAEAWFAKYDVMPLPLVQALDTTNDIPIDITPKFELSPEARAMRRPALCCVAFLLAALPCAPAIAQKPLVLHHHDAAHQLPGTIIVPASDFYLNMAEGDSNDGRFPAGTWFFNENTINLGAAADVTAAIPVHEAGCTTCLCAASARRPARSG